MDHHDHVHLLRGGVPGPGGVWADFGSGRGAFTLALADLIGPTGQIFSVDQDGGALREQARLMRQHFPAVAVDYRQADFTRPLDLPALDGLVIANALHFHSHKQSIVQRLRDYLKPGGHFILIEYNVDQGNRWVPYPMTYATWAREAQRTGLAETRYLTGVPTHFLHEIYSALSIKARAPLSS